jgi:hypothetical protein
MFQKLTLSNWRQFKHIELSFHDRLTVLTGANGAGKTSILSLLSQHFGWDLFFISTPYRSKTGSIRFFTDKWHDSEEPAKQVVGQLLYSDGHSAELTVPPDVNASYRVEISSRRSVSGLYITSHRPVYVYKKVETIPTELNARDQLLGNYLNELRSRYAIGARAMSPSFRIKESLIALATFGYGNKAITANAEAIRMFEGFQDILRIILPASLGFQRIQITPPEVILETATGPFSFDAVSGGVASLIDTAWQLFMCKIVNDENRFVAIIDEPENHLHPELQQTLLPHLLKAFPTAQFIVATHNPLIITSVPESQIYVLIYNDQRAVESRTLDFVNKAASANEVLRDVLGLPFTVPVWVKERVDSVVRKYQDRQIDRGQLESLRAEMAQLGFDHLIPQTIGRVLKESDDSGN